MISVYWISLIMLIVLVVYLYTKRKLGKVDNPFLPQIHEEIKIIDNDAEYELPWDVKKYSSINKELYTKPKALELTETLKNKVNDIAKLTPNMKEIVQVEKKIVVRFSEEVMQKIKSGELKVMKKKGSMDEFRAIAVDQKNKIRNHGEVVLQDIKKVNPAQLANAALGVLTVITAQEHLDRINQQLGAIDNKLNKLLRYYENDKVGKIQGSIRYLKSILPEIASNEINSPIYLTKIEDISHNCYQEIQSLLLEFPRSIQSLRNIQEKNYFGIKDPVEEMKDLSNDFEQRLLWAFGNIEVMSVCLKIRNELEDKSEVNLKRLSDIEDDYKKVINYHEELKRILQSKRDGLDAKFRTNKAVAEKKLEIERQISYHIESMRTNISTINEHISQLKNNKTESLKDVFDLQVDYDEEGKVRGVYKLQKIN